MGLLTTPMNMKTLIAFISGATAASFAHKILKSAQAKALAQKSKALSQKVQEFFRNELRKHLTEQPKK